MKRALTVLLVAASALAAASEQQPETRDACSGAFAARARELLPRHQVAVAVAPTKGAEALKELVLHDQQIRALLREAARACARGPSDEEMRPILQVMRSIDADNQRVLRSVLQSVGWPSSATWGSEVADAAFLIVQHADQAPALQEQGLALLEPLVATGEAPADVFALLFDRTRVNAGKPQRYGTQGNCRGAAWTPRPMEDPEQVDARRVAVGLEPLAEYAQVASQLGCRR